MAISLGILTQHFQTNPNRHIFKDWMVGLSKKPWEALVALPNLQDSLAGANRGWGWPKYGNKSSTSALGAHVWGLYIQEIHGFSNWKLDGSQSFSHPSPVCCVPAKSPVDSPACPSHSSLPPRILQVSTDQTIASTKKMSEHRLPPKSHASSSYSFIFPFIFPSQWPNDPNGQFKSFSETPRSQQLHQATEVWIVWPATSGQVAVPWRNGCAWHGDQPALESVPEASHGQRAAHFGLSQSVHQWY